MRRSLVSFLCSLTSVWMLASVASSCRTSVLPSVRCLSSLGRGYLSIHRRPILLNVFLPFAVLAAWFPADAGTVPVVPFYFLTSENSHHA